MDYREKTLQSRDVYILALRNVGPLVANIEVASDLTPLGQNDHVPTMAGRILGPSRTLARSLARPTHTPQSPFTRTVATAAPQKREGDISDAFASLSGRGFAPLEPRFADVKARLIQGYEREIEASWKRLLSALQHELPLISQLGSSVIPTIDFKDIDNASDSFRAEHKKRGVAVIRNVLPTDEALALKDDLRSYIKANPQTKAFPPENPQVCELYWSKSQIRARAHPNMIKAQRFLMEFWHSRDPNALVSSSHPTLYADRLRMRMPGDAKFALGPHVDGGSCERWEEEGYGKGGVYESIWKGQWEEYDPWESSKRLPVVSDLYQGVGACSMFRMFQGWLSCKCKTLCLFWLHMGFIELY